MNPRDRGLVESEEQDENKKMKSIVVEEQEEGSESESETGFVYVDQDMLHNVLKLGEQEERSESESESGFVDLDEDTLRNVLKRVHTVTLMRAACVNRLWCTVAESVRFWERPVIGPSINGQGPTGFITCRHGLVRGMTYERVNLPQVVKPPPLDFYSIDPQVFSSQIGPWVQNTEELTNNRG